MWRTLQVLAALTVSVALSASIGCGGNGPSDPTADQSVPAEDRDVTTALHVPAADPAAAEGDKRLLWSEDRSVSLRLPGDWHEVDSYPDHWSWTRSWTLLAAANFPFPEDVVASTCRPGRVLRHMPPDGAYIQIAEQAPPPRPGKLRKISDPRPDTFRLGKPKSYECGPSFIFDFREKGRALSAMVFVRPRGRAWPAKRLGPGGFDAETRAQVKKVLNSLELQPAGAEPVRNPFMALDCRTHPITVTCDRIFVHLSTRVPMRSVAVRIGERVAELNAAGKSSRGVVPAGRRRTVWTGYMRDAGLTTEGSPLEVPLPEGERRWSGVPEVEADVEVIARRPGAPADNWLFPGVKLVPGRG